MKYLFTLFTICLIYLQVLAQNHNLQYNQVRFITHTATSSTGQTTLINEPLVVPANTVLKIENAYVTLEHTTTGAISPAVSYAMTISGHALYATTASNSQPVSFPIWISAGTYTIKVFQFNGAAAGYNVNAFISATEFNEVP